MDGPTESVQCMRLFLTWYEVCGLDLFFMMQCRRAIHSLTHLKGKEKEFTISEMGKRI